MSAAATEVVRGRSASPIEVEYRPQPGLARLTIVNLLLNVITLSIYRFWAKTRVRRHIWSCIYINGEPLEYTGRGVELFLGALFVTVALVVPIILIVFFIRLTFGPESPQLIGFQMLVLLITTVLWGGAKYLARRYQLSRTLWRGIRFSLAGSAMVYSLLFFGALLLRGLTMGWATPFMNLNLQEQMTASTLFGDRHFRFKGRAGPLYPAFALCWFITLAAAIAAIVFLGYSLSREDSPLLAWLAQLEKGTSGEPSVESIVTLMAAIFGFYVVAGLAYVALWTVYVAREMRLFATYTSFEEARIALDASAGSLFRLQLGNLLIWLFTLGIAMPFVHQRTVRYHCDLLTVAGNVDLAAIRQSSADISRTGEGLAAALDLGGI